MSSPRPSFRLRPLFKKAGERGIFSIPQPKESLEFSEPIWGKQKSDSSHQSIGIFPSPRNTKKSEDDMKKHKGNMKKYEGYMKKYGGYMKKYEERLLRPINERDSPYHSG